MSSTTQLSDTSTILNPTPNTNTPHTPSIPTRGRVLLMIANSYINTPYRLGDPVYHDCVIMSSAYTEKGYLSYTLLDPSREEFIHWLTQFLSMKYDDLVVYYSGHGVQIREKVDVFDYELGKYVSRIEMHDKFTITPSSHTLCQEIFKHREDDGYDECLTFISKPAHTSCPPSLELMTDDELAMLVCHNCCKHVLLVIDACHSETMCDVVPENVCVISACKDNQLATQQNSNSSTQLLAGGIFTHYLIKYFNQDISTLITNINKKVSRYGQTATWTNTTARSKLFI